MSYGPDSPRCIYPETRAALRQAHVLWHRALDAYTDPFEFTLALETLLTSLRTVTRRLRTEGQRRERASFKAGAAVERGAFEVWFKDREDRERADPLRKWAIQSRNYVQKEGSLSTKSTARLTVRSRYHEHAELELDADPLEPTETLVQQVPLDKLPESVRNEGTIVLERRWLDGALPDREVLDVLAYCYGQTAGMVADALRWEGETLLITAADAHDSRVQEATSHPYGPLPCMVVESEERKVHWDIRGGKLIQAPIQPMGSTPLTPEQLQHVEQRYGPIPRPSPAQLADPLEFTRARHRAAETMYRVDGYLIPVVQFLGPAPTKHDAMRMAQSSRSERPMMELMVHTLVVEVLARQPGVLLLMSVSAYSQAEDTPEDEKTPAIITMMVFPDGWVFSCFTPLVPTESGYVLGEYGEQAQDHPPRWLEPVLAVWNVRNGPSVW